MSSMALYFCLKWRRLHVCAVDAMHIPALPMFLTPSALTAQWTQIGLETDWQDTKLGLYGYHACVIDCGHNMALSNCAYF